MLIFFKIMFVKKRKQKYLVFIQEYKMNIISMNIVFIYCKNIKHKLIIFNYINLKLRVIYLFTYL